MLGGLIPRRIDQGVLGDLVELALQGPIVLDSALAFFRLLLADGLGSAPARDEARPTIVRRRKVIKVSIEEFIAYAVGVLRGWMT